MAAFYICLGIWVGGPDCGVCGTSNQLSGAKESYSLSCM